MEGGGDGGRECFAIPADVSKDLALSFRLCLSELGVVAHHLDLLLGVEPDAQDQTTGLPQVRHRERERARESKRGRVRARVGHQAQHLMPF
jgi:hypothetical protein